MGAIASQITSPTIIYSTVYSRHTMENAENVSVWWRHNLVEISPSYVSMILNIWANDPNVVQNALLLLE